MKEWDVPDLVPNHLARDVSKHKNWPGDCNVSYLETKLAWPDTDAGRIECLCSVSFPAPDSAGIRLLYISGRGECKSTWFAHGYGPDAATAEAAARGMYQKIIDCQHDIQPIAHVDLPDPQPKVYLLDGDAICAKCEIYLPFYFMDERLHASMRLANRGHEGQKRKYSGRPYIAHPQQVYNRTAFWKAMRPQGERVVMGCAAWMHDLKKDCPHISDDEIIAAGGVDAYELVCWLTNPSKGSKLSRAKRKEIDRDHIRSASPPAKVIKMLDRICNLGDMEECDEPGFLSLYAAESRLLLEAVGDADEALAVELFTTIGQAESRSQS